MNIEPTAADVGKMIWVRDDEDGPWFLRRLVRLDETPLGLFFVCERCSESQPNSIPMGPATHVWHHAKRDSKTATKLEAYGEKQIATVDPETMAGRCYTCRFWIDAAACEQVAAFERPPRTFNQICRECWASYPAQRPMTMAHDLCARWEQKTGLHYQPE
jgi:hypothetical protein